MHGSGLDRAAARSNDNTQEGVILLAGLVGASLLVTACATTDPPSTEVARFRAAVDRTFRTWAVEDTSGTSIRERLARVDDYQLAGEFGWARGTYTIVTRPKAGGDPFIDVGPFLTVFKRQADGSWKLCRTVESGVPE